MKIYHVTSSSSVSSILSKGLKPSSGSSGVINDSGGHRRGIYFFTSIPQMVSELGLDFSIWVVPDPLASVLEISLPEEWPLKTFDEYGDCSFISLYSTRSIPSKFIKDLGGLSRFARLK